MGGIHQLVTRQLLYLSLRHTALYLVPSCHGEKGFKHLALLLRTPHHVECQMQVLLRAPFLCKVQTCLGARTIAFLCLHSARHRRLKHITYGRHVIVANPLPQPHLLMSEHRLVVEHLFDVFPFHLWLRLMHSHSHSNIVLALAQRHQNTHAHSHLRRPLLGQAVGEQPLKGYWQYDINEIHLCE